MKSGLEQRLAATRAAVGRRQPFWLGDKTLQYPAFFDAIDRVAGLVAARGWAPGVRVGLACRHALDTTVLFVGLVRCGVTVVNLDPDAPPERLQSILAASDLTALVADGEAIDTLTAASALPTGLESIALRPRERSGFKRLLASLIPEDRPLVIDLLEDVAPGSPPDHIDETAPAYILFTSGSTSRPKGVEISHRALCAQIEEFAQKWEVEASSRILNLLPLHHTDGLNMGPMLALWRGAAVVRPFRFRVDRLPELFDQVYAQKVTHFVGVPSLMALALDLVSDRADAFQTPEFRHFISTAAYLDPTLWTRFQDTFSIRVSNCYGLTETVSQILYCGPDDASWRLGTVGRPLFGKARVVDEHGTERGVDEPGELQVQGDNLMTGYFRDPEETAAALVDGWLRTGDLATRDADGFFRIVGRSKNVIITGGINVYPEEIDEEVRALEGVRDAATVGVDDRVWGERAVTAVVLAQGSSLTPEGVLRDLTGRLAPEKRPWQVLVVEDLPRGPSGKVVGPELKQIVAALLASRSTERASTGPLTESRFLEMAARYLSEPVERLTLASTPDDVGGWSSLAHLELILALEDVIGQELSPQEVLSIRSLDDMLRAALRAGERG